MSARENRAAWGYGIECLADTCDGRITGRVVWPNRELFDEGDEMECPKCHARYVIRVTEDYEDDAVASLEAIP
jgi:hypothetical protein